MQTWGLLELQRGNTLPAVLMLERAVKLQPTCSPVLNWQLVSEARKAVGSRQRRTGTKTPCTAGTRPLGRGDIIDVEEDGCPAAVTDLYWMTK